MQEDYRGLNRKIPLKLCMAEKIISTTRLKENKKTGLEQGLEWAVPMGKI